MQETLMEKLRSEITTASWPDLVRPFAFGRVYQVRAPWTLQDAALALHQDASELVKAALQDQRLTQPSDDEARHWQATQAQFDMLIISPFVLIQAKTAPENLH